MLIVGAGGLAAQIFPDIEAMHLRDIVFWSEYDTRYSFIRENYRIVNNDIEVAEYFRSINRQFILCVGQPDVRRQMAEKFTDLGGTLTSYVSPYATVSRYANVGVGSTILSNVIVEPATVIKEGCLLNKTSNVGHGCIMNEYCELAPAVILTGEVELGANCYIGTGTIILPKVQVGANSVIAAGAVVKRNIPPRSLVSGGNAVVVKTLQEI
jgi:sugar O-acyltransferase (sialic acid O-acetyltransferase NeuD family)